MNFDDDKLYDLRTISDATGLDTVLLSRMANRGQLPAKKFGRRWMVKGAQLKVWLETGTEPQKDGE